MSGALPPLPTPRVDDIVDTLHGVRVPDPDRWLENADDPAVTAWTAAQNAHTRAALDALPTRAERYERLVPLLRVGGIAAPMVAGERCFAIERHGDLDQAVLTVRPLDDPDAAATLVDPHRLTGDDTAALDWYQPDTNGRYVTYGISVGGDERSTLSIIDVESGEVLADTIPHTRAASVAWAPDGSGFAYTRYPAPGDVPDDELGYHRHVYWHDLGTDPADDRVLLDDLPDPTAWPTIELDDDGRRLLVTLSLGWSRTDVRVIDLVDGAVRIVAEDPGGLAHLGWVGERLLGVTTIEADRGRVVEVPTAATGPDDWLTLVAEGDDVIDGVEPAGGELLVVRSRRAVSRITRHGADGAPLGDIELPTLGALAGLSGHRHRTEAIVGFTSFGIPSGLLHWSGTRAPNWWATPPTAPDPDQLAVEQLRFESTDGTEVGLFVVTHRDHEPGPDTPTVLTGYGGFAIANAPTFSAGIVEWCAGGGQWAVALIRGGSEEGEAWHRAGMLEHKQQSFDDFFAAADHLVASGRTSPARLALRGGSNGGLLMGATLTQRPDLAAAVHCAVPLLDMLRFHRFLIARLWIPEYGDPDDPEHFAWLHAYSPYHRVVDGTCYPATLITTAEEDSRVDPVHARKMAARLQRATSCADSRPILVRIEERAGHGQGKPVGRQAEELADVFAFYDAHLGRGD